MNEYKYHQDPGHGWMEVPADDLKTFVDVKEISHFSYVSTDGSTVYLEEDVDMSTFIMALKEHDVEFDLTDVFHDEPCFIRQLCPFSFF